MESPSAFDNSTPDLIPALVQDASMPWRGFSDVSIQSPSSVPHLHTLGSDGSHRPVETDNRLRILAYEMAPLMDRFGRVLSDFSHHIHSAGRTSHVAEAVPLPAASANTNMNSLGFTLNSLLRQSLVHPQYYLYVSSHA